MKLENRVILFKRKIRETLGLENVRFITSSGKSHLIPDLDRFVAWDDPKFGVEMQKRLFSAGIEFEKVVDQYGIWRNSPDRDDHYYLSIPIDQAALPESSREFA